MLTATTGSDSGCAWIRPSSHVAWPRVRRSGADRLRDWRSSVSSAEKMPAYLVLSDKDLFAIADARPRTLTELAGCRGIGPMKLERWGDEILAALD